MHGRVPVCVRALAGQQEEAAGASAQLGSWRQACPSSCGRPLNQLPLLSTAPNPQAHTTTKGLAFAPARLVTISLTALTSASVRSLPPVMLYTMPAREQDRRMQGGGGLGVERGRQGKGGSLQGNAACCLPGRNHCARGAGAAGRAAGAGGRPAASTLPPGAPTCGPLNALLDEGSAGGGHGRLLGAVLAAGHAHAQHGGAGIGHDGPHVGKVDIDQAWHCDDVADALQEAGVGEGCVVGGLCAFVQGEGVWAWEGRAGAGTHPRLTSG